MEDEIGGSGSTQQRKGMIGERCEKARKYLKTGDYYLTKEDIDQALVNYRKCLQVAKEKDLEAECLSNFKIGVILVKKN